MRTASKAYALAGMRVGFAIARRELLADVEPYRPPGSVAIPSVAVVTAALRDPDVLAANVARVGRERDRLAAGLAGLGLAARPSVTNFLLVDLGSPARAHGGRGRPARRAGSCPGRSGPITRWRATSASPSATRPQDDLLLAALAAVLPAAGAARAPAPPRTRSSQP